MKERLGNLAKTGLPTLLHLVYEKGDAAGILDVINDPARKRFFFKNGMPVAASSNVLSEVLGRLLMAERIISQRDYETSLEVVLREKKKHGEVLISMGLITPAELERFLTLQLKRRLFKVFGWKHGEYRYIKAESLPPAVVDLKPLHPAPLIIEGITLGFYPTARAREDLISQLDTVFKIADPPGKCRPEDFNINLQEQRFLKSFNGAKSLKEVLGGSDLLRGRANALALSFIITGVVTPASPAADEQPELEESTGEAASEAAGPERLNAELLFMKAKTAFKARDYKEAIEILKAITELSPAEGEYWAYLGWAVYNDDPSRLKEAEKIIRDALDLNNDLDSAWHFLGELSLAAGDTESAEKFFRTALAKNPWALESLAELKRIEIKGALGEAPDMEARKKYIDAFAFPEDPFEAAPGPVFLEISRQRTDTLEAIVDEIRKSGGPILLEGVEGSGKTAFCLELLKRLSGEKVLCACLLEPAKTELLIMKAITRELGCSTDSSSVKEELLSLGMRVSQNRTQGGQTIIIIDEANRLSPGGVKLVQYLSRLKTLQLVLAAGPYFSESLKAPEFEELDKKLALRHSLNALTLEETKEYILKSINGARRRGKPAAFSITAEALKLVFEESGGLPAEINRLAAIMLERAAGLNKTILDIEAGGAASRKEEAFAAPSSPHPEAPAAEVPAPATMMEAAPPAEPPAKKPEEGTVKIHEAEPEEEPLLEEISHEKAAPPQALHIKEAPAAEGPAPGPMMEAAPPAEPPVEKPEEGAVKIHEAARKEKPLLKEMSREKAAPARAPEPPRPLEAPSRPAPPLRAPEIGASVRAGRAAPEKPPKGTSKARAFLIFILIVLVSILAGIYVRKYILDRENAEKTPVTVPGPLSPDLPKDMNAPLMGSVTGEQVPVTDAQRAQDRAAALSATAKPAGMAR